MVFVLNTRLGLDLEKGIDYVTGLEAKMLVASALASSSMRPRPQHLSRLMSKRGMPPNNVPVSINSLTERFVQQFWIYVK